MNDAKPYRTYTKALIVLPEGEPIFSEMATVVEIDDEAGGPFVVVKQHGRIERPGEHHIAIDREDWPALRQAIDAMMIECERMAAT